VVYVNSGIRYRLIVENNAETARNNKPHQDKYQRPECRKGALMAIAGLGWLTYSVKLAREVSVPVQSGRRSPQGSSGVPLAARDVRERSTMEGAGQRGGATAIVAHHPLDSITLLRRKEYERKGNDGTHRWSIAAPQGQNRGRF
jgi:hypothetical protein